MPLKTFAGFDENGNPDWDDVTDQILAVKREQDSALADEILAELGMHGGESVADYYHARRPQLSAELAKAVGKILAPFMDTGDDDDGESV